MDSIVLAHVADALTEIIDHDSDYRAVVDYDAVADDAANLLTRVPELAETVEQWNTGAITWEALVARVREAQTAMFTLNADGAWVTHAALGDDPLCGWIAAAGSVTGDAGGVTCLDCIAAMAG